MKKSEDKELLIAALLVLGVIFGPPLSFVYKNVRRITLTYPALVILLILGSAGSLIGYTLLVGYSPQVLTFALIACIIGFAGAVVAMIPPDCGPVPETN
jgi:uncharacterized membrane protein YfcA